MTLIEPAGTIPEHERAALEALRDLTDAQLHGLIRIARRYPSRTAFGRAAQAREVAECQAIVAARREGA